MLDDRIELFVTCSLCLDEHKEEGRIADNIRDSLPWGQDDTRMYKNVQYVCFCNKICSVNGLSAIFKSLPPEIGVAPWCDQQGDFLLWIILHLLDDEANHRYAVSFVHLTRIICTTVCNLI